MARLCERRVGYDRLVGEHAYRQLTELYRALRLYVNCFQPSMKLLAKQRDGKKVRYVYDPARTPLQRLLLSGVLLPQKQQELTEVVQALDPIRLFQQLEQLQQAVFRCAVSCYPVISPIPAVAIRVFSQTIVPWLRFLKRGMSPIRQQGSRPCTESKSGENASWAGGAPTRTPLPESGSRSCPGW
jgi:hypothetical protein